MKSTTWLMILACALPILGLLLTVVDIYEAMDGFAKFMHQSNAKPDDIKAVVGTINQQLASAWKFAIAGVIGGFVVAVVLVVRLQRQRQSPPPLPTTSR